MSWWSDTVKQCGIAGVDAEPEICRVASNCTKSHVLL